MSTVNSKKKSTTTSQVKSEDAEKSKKEEITEENDEEKTNRKSLRLKNSLTKPAPTATATTTTSKRRQVNETVNGAQFVSAASVGKINVNNNNNLSESNGDAKQIDLVKLSQNVDEMSKILTEHAGLFKKLTNSIDKLSNKLDNTVKNINTADHQAKKANKATEQNSDTGNAKLQMRGRLKKRRNDDEAMETEKVDEENCAKKIKHQELEEKNEIADDEEDDIELINQNKLITSSEQDKKITFTANSNVIASNESGKLIKLKLEDDLPPNESQDGNIKASTNSSSKEILNVDDGNKKDSADSTNADHNQSKTNNSSLNNSNYMTDSSKSDDDDEDDDDEYDDEDGNGSKKSRSSTNSHKSSNIAILNKTKIDTEFISNLIANKDPNDKRYDPNEINKLRLLSHSYQNFAVKLLVRLFDEEEIIGRNVYGRNYSGDKSVMKQPLDPERINFIKETVLRLTKTNNPELAWSSCVIAMNRKMVDINNKYKKK